MFWVEFPEQGILCPNFVKLRTLGHLWILLVLSWCKWLLVCNDFPRGIWGVTKRECNSMLLRIKEEITNPTVVEMKKKEYALTMERKKSEEQHQRTKFENVLVGIDKFNFPINLVTLHRKEDNQASAKGRLFNALSQAGIDTEYGEMTLLVGKEK